MGASGTNGGKCNPKQFSFVIFVSFVGKFLLKPCQDRALCLGKVCFFLAVSVCGWNRGIMKRRELRCEPYNNSEGGQWGWSVKDRWNNEIVLTDERWQHIVDGHWELDKLLDEVLRTIRLGRANRIQATPTSIAIQKDSLLCRTVTRTSLLLCVYCQINL